MNQSKIHHANIIFGTRDHKDFVFDILIENFNFKVSANPDFIVHENESFGIDDARNLSKWAATKSFLGGIKASLVVAKSITHEAQNALLKVLEEPPEETYFFIILENGGDLLPTLLSRVRILDHFIKYENGYKEKDKKFMKSKIGERFSIANSFLKSENKSNLKEFLSALEQISFENGFQKTKNGLENESAKKILTAKIFASTRGASPKMLLEWLACNI